jgi:hypothetical protein
MQQTAKPKLSEKARELWNKIKHEVENRAKVINKAIEIQEENDKREIKKAKEKGLSLSIPQTPLSNRRIDPAKILDFMKKSPGSAYKELVNPARLTQNCEDLQRSAKKSIDVLTQSSASKNAQTESITFGGSGHKSTVGSQACLKESLTKPVSQEGSILNHLSSMPVPQIDLKLVPIPVEFGGSGPQNPTDLGKEVLDAGTQTEKHKSSNSMQKINIVSQYGDKSIPQWMVHYSCKLKISLPGREM